MTDPETPGLHLLLVEDNDDDVLMVEEALKKLSHSVRLSVVSDGPGALELLRNEETDPVDLIIMDLNMPLMSGFELLRRLRDEADPSVAKTPAVVMSTSDRPEDIDRAQAAGASDYVVKPTYFKELIDVLDRLTGKWTKA